MASIGSILAQGGVEPFEPQQVQEQQWHRLLVEQEKRRALDEQRQLAKQQQDQADDRAMAEVLTMGAGDPAKTLELARSRAPRRYLALQKMFDEHAKADSDRTLQDLEIRTKESEDLAMALTAVETVPPDQQEAAYQQVKANAAARHQAQLPPNYPGTLANGALYGIAGLGASLHKIAAEKQKQDLAERAAKAAEKRADLEERKFQQEVKEFEKPPPKGEWAEFKASGYYDTWLEAEGKKPTARNQIDAFDAWKSQKTPGPRKLLTPEEEAQQLRLRKASGSEDKPPESLMLVPTPGGGYQGVRVRPGTKVPEGAVSPAGASSMAVPTAATRSMIEAAPKIKGFASRIRPQIEQQRKQLGPVAGRWAEFMTGKVGDPNPEFAKLRTNVALLQTQLLRMHVGARGGQEMMEHFKNLIDVGKQSPENLLAVLDEIEQYANDVGKTQGVEGVRNQVQAEPPAAPKVRKYNPATGKLE